MRAFATGFAGGYHPNDNPIPTSAIYKLPSSTGFYEDSTSKDCKTIAEQAQGRKPAFNTGTGRDTRAQMPTVGSFNPGPGSYSTRISSIKTQFVKKEWGKQEKEAAGKVGKKLSPVN